MDNVNARRRIFSHNWNSTFLSPVTRRTITMVEFIVDENSQINHALSRDLLGKFMQTRAIETHRAEWQFGSARSECVIIIGGSHELGIFQLRCGWVDCQPGQLITAHLSKQNAKFSCLIYLRLDCWKCNWLRLCHAYLSFNLFLITISCPTAHAE